VLCMLQLERPLVSRVREIRMHGLKGVPAPSCESAGRSRFYQSQAIRLINVVP